MVWWWMVMIWVVVRCRGGSVCDCDMSWSLFVWIISVDQRSPGPAGLTSTVPTEPPAMASLLCAFSLLHHPPCREYVETDSQTTHPTNCLKDFWQFSVIEPLISGWYGTWQMSGSAVDILHFSYLLPSIAFTDTTIGFNFNQNKYTGVGGHLSIDELLRDFQDIFPQPSSNIWDGKRWVECSLAEPQLDEMRYSCYFYPVIVV